MSLSLVEFLSPISKSPQRDKCLAVLYYHSAYKNIPAMSVGEVRSALVSARVPRAKSINVAAVLAAAGSLVDTSDMNTKGHKLWHLTSTGIVSVRALLGLPDERPEIAHDVVQLRRQAASIQDEVARSFVEEGVLALEVGALRAAIVFLWSGAVRVLQERATAQSWAVITAAVQKHDQRAKVMGKMEDFAQVRDKILLLALRELAVIDKSEWTILQADLDLRNQCGHPTRFRPGPKKASALIEDLISIVFK